MAERVAALRQTERRQRILAEHADLMARARESGVMIVINRFESMYLLADPVDYDLKAASSLTELARAQGADPAEWVYDAMLEHDGTQLFYAPILNFADRNFGAIQEMITSPETLFGLSNAGAHCGAICDASFTTSYLTTWVRDRKGVEAIPLERVVHQLTRRPAEHIGWLDRGLLSPGYLADVNIIDFDGLGCGRRGSSTTCLPAVAASCRTQPGTATPSRKAFRPSKTGSLQVSTLPGFCAVPARPLDSGSITAS